MPQRLQDGGTRRKLGLCLPRLFEGYLILYLLESRIKSTGYQRVARIGSTPEEQRESKLCRWITALRAAFIPTIHWTLSAPESRCHRAGEGCRVSLKAVVHFEPFQRLADSRIDDKMR